MSEPSASGRCRWSSSRAKSGVSSTPPLGAIQVNRSAVSRSPSASSWSATVPTYSCSRSTFTDMNSTCARRSGRRSVARKDAVGSARTSAARDDLVEWRDGEVEASPLPDGGGVTSAARAMGKVTRCQTAPTAMRAAWTRKSGAAADAGASASTPGTHPLAQYAALTAAARRPRLAVGTRRVRSMRMPCARRPTNAASGRKASRVDVGPPAPMTHAMPREDSASAR
mmetsp:Transcript_4848/g.15677  ORF Transcript_4848/g.15677 Transcript_4848/m.15677 type:complete len:226 (-) Transcript_4848:477-1154(-)